MIKKTEVRRIAWPPTADDIKAQLARLKITQVEAADLLRIDPRTMRRYLQSPGVTIPFASFALLSLTKRGEA